jgi:hypothetical protein
MQVNIYFFKNEKMMYGEVPATELVTQNGKILATELGHVITNTYTGWDYIVAEYQPLIMTLVTKDTTPYASVKDI